MNSHLRITALIASLAAGAAFGQHRGGSSGHPSGGGSYRGGSSAYHSGGGYYHGGGGYYGGPRISFGVGLGGFGYGGLGLYGYPYGYGSGYGLGVPLGTWSGSPTYIAAAPVVPSGAPVYIDRGVSTYVVPGVADPNGPVASFSAQPLTVSPPAVDPAAANSVLVKVSVPDPNAQVFFGEATTAATGSERVFRSPPLQPGQAYSYTLKARWTENGKPVERTRTATVHAGETLTVSFAEAGVERAPPPNPIPETALPMVPQEPMSPVSGK